ncbi:MAG: DUF5119 domain-containing protein [Mucinivorans sp.]
MRRVILILVFAIFAVSCSRDHLYYGTDDRVLIELDIDWTVSQLTPNGVSVAAYNADGTLFGLFCSANPALVKLLLPCGRYDLVIYNNTADEFRNIAFRGVDRKSTYESYANAKKSLSVRTTCPLVCEPDEVAVARVDGVEVTPDMVQYYYDRPQSDDQIAVRSIKVTPHRVVVRANIRAHVRGLCYAAGAPLVQLRNLSGSYLVGQGINVENPVGYEFIMNNRTFDPGSTENGTISNRISTFGLIDTRYSSKTKYYLDLDFVLIDGKHYPLSIDVTDKITERTTSLNLVIDVAVSIELPEVIGGGGGGAFDTDVDEWHDSDVPIEM